MHKLVFLGSLQYGRSRVAPHLHYCQGASAADPAQTGQLVLAAAELKFDEAMSNLMHSSLSLFQPIELFPLFPDVTAPWADQIPTKQYWGLHQPLAPLQSLLAREEQAQARTLLEQDAMQSIAGYLLQVAAPTVMRT